MLAKNKREETKSLTPITKKAIKKQMKKEMKKQKLLR